MNDIDNPLLAPEYRVGIDGLSRVSLFDGELNAAMRWLHDGGWSLVEHEVRGRSSDGRSLWHLNYIDGTEDERQRIVAFERLVWAA